MKPLFLIAALLLTPHAWAKPILHADIVKLRTRYLDGLFAARPHLATFMGDHRFDDKIVDLSDDALDKRRKELAAVLKQVDTFYPNEDELVDLAIIRDGAKLELLYLDEIRDFAWDPRLHDSLPYYDPRETVAARLSDIIHGDYAPAATRKKSVLAELQALPRYLTQTAELLLRPYRGTVPANWRRPPLVYVEQAIKDNEGRIAFMKSDVAPFVAGEAHASERVDQAVAALEQYTTTLKTELLPKADGDWRLGRDLYDKKFKLALQTERTPAEMLVRARASFAHDRAQLAALARTLHHKLFPGEKLPKSDVAVISNVKDKLSQDHAKPDELVAAHARRLDALRAFIETNKLVELPPRDTLSVEPMPLFKRGSVAAEYLAPGMLSRSKKFHATYYVDPIDPTWPKDKVESYLRGQNDYEVELVAAHEAYPGHHTQTALARKELDPLRATLWNGAMVEGWAVFAEGQLVTRGWGGDNNDRYRFFDLRGRMVSAANLILDVTLQRGDMTDDAAVRFMVDEGFQEKAMAEKKLLRAKLDSTQLCQYFLGLDEIESLLSDDVRALAVTEASPQVMHDFNMRLISHGSIAVKFLRDYVLPKAKPAP